MTTALVTQGPVEVLTHVGTIYGRVTQGPVEVLTHVGTIYGKVTQSPVEVLTHPVTSAVPNFAYFQLAIKIFALLTVLKCLL